MERRRVYRKRNGRKYSKKDRKTVATYLHDKTYEEIGQMIGRNARSVMQHALHVMKVVKRPDTKRWTEKDKAILRRLFGTMECGEIGKELGRTAQSVRMKAKRMGLTYENRYDDSGIMLKTCKKGRKIIWRASEISYLRQHYNTDTYPELCEYFGISKYTIHKKAKELGLEKDIEAINAHKRKNIRQAILQHVINSHKRKKNGNISEPRSDSGIEPGGVPHV